MKIKNKNKLKTSIILTVHKLSDWDYLRAFAHYERLLN